MFFAPGIARSELVESLHEPLSLRKLKETHLAPGPPLTLVKISGASQRPFETCHQSLAVDLQGLPTLRHVEVPVWSGLVWSGQQKTCINIYW